MKEPTIPASTPPAPAVGSEQASARIWVLRKRGLFYRPGDRGYTGNINDAGRYTYEEAKQRVYPHDEPVTMHLASDFGAAGSADLDAAIGAMLDEWDRLPNDLKWDSDHVRLRAKVEALEAAALRRNPNQSGGGQ